MALTNSRITDLVKLLKEQFLILMIFMMYTHLQRYLNRYFTYRE